MRVSSILIFTNAPDERGEIRNIREHVTKKNSLAIPKKESARKKTQLNRKFFLQLVVFSIETEFSYFFFI